VGPLRSAIAALAIAAFQCVTAHRSGVSLALPKVSTLLFAIFIALSLVISNGGVEWRFARAVVTGTLSLVLLVTSWRSPLTEAYVRADSKPSLWSDPHFSTDNGRLARHWSAAFGVVAISFTFGAILRGSVATTLLNWLAPILVLALAVARASTVPIETTGSRLVEAVELLSSGRGDGDSRGRGPGPRLVE